MALEHMQMFLSLEEKVNEAFMKKTYSTVEMMHENSRMMKSVLRIPRLCSKFHEYIRGSGMEEYDALEKVYNSHYLSQAELDLMTSEENLMRSSCRKTLFNRSFNNNNSSM